jgi:WD40 repeat protein
MAMKRMLAWWKGLVALVAVVAFALALAWLLRAAGQGPAVGQPAASADTPLPERRTMPTDTVLFEKEEAPIATPETLHPTRILYAVQPLRGAATLWTLDLTPRGEVLASSELITSPIPVEGLRLYEISISPDGRHAALNLRGRAEDLDVEVWTVDLVSGAVVQLPQLRQSGLVFMDWIPGINRLLTTDLNGAVVALITPDGSDVQELPYHFFQDGAASPDGQQFVLSAMDENTFWFMNADGTLIRTVLVPDKERPGGGAPFGLAWSPDGQKLAYFDNFADENSQIRVMDVNTGGLSYLSSADAGSIFPVWFQDSATLLYLRDPRPGTVNWDGGDPTRWNTSLWTADVETEQYRELVSSGGKACWSPAWLPDGSGIVFVSNRSGWNDIWLVNRDGSGLRQLTTRGNVAALGVFPSK